MGEETLLTPEICGVCQCPLEAAEGREVCPACALPFHADCWEQNYGCSAYGCSQVNALQPVRNAAVPAAARPGALTAASPEPFPWDFLLLGISVLALLASVFSFGVPSAVLALVALGSLFRKRKKAVAVLLLSLLVCLAGAIGGPLVFYFLLMASPAAR
jgi:hypothetical protein